MAIDVTSVSSDDCGPPVGQLGAEDVWCPPRPALGRLLSCLSDSPKESLFLFVSQALDDHVLIGQRPGAGENLFARREPPLLRFVS